MQQEAPLSEADRVFAHRWLRCQRLGMDDQQADLVAAAAIDLHEIEHLLNAGCPLHLAIRIIS